LRIDSGIWGAIRFSTFTAEKLYDYFDMTGRYVGVIAFLITFGIIVIIIHFIGILADKVVSAASLGLLTGFSDFIRIKLNQC